MPIRLLLVMGLLSGCADPFMEAVWVTRWDYRSAADVRSIIRNCADAGFDGIIFQVRGNGTVFYRSEIEPWAEEFDFRDPGFDPLAVACAEARRQRIELHAWVNAVPGWRGITPPGEPNQLYRTHPEWFLTDQRNERQPLKENYYVALNPCWPEVREHVARVCEEIVRKYPVTGIHLDYIRFLEREKGRSYPRDARSLDRFQAATGHRIPPTASDEELPPAVRAAWERWKAEQVTDLVRLIRRRIREASPTVELSAAVFRTPEIARELAAQDWAQWLEEGLLEAVFPMQYDRENDRFRKRVRICRETTRKTRVIMGIGAYLHEDPGQTVQQMVTARSERCDGFCLFAYSSFFASPADARENPPADELRQRRRALVLSRVYR